MVVDDELVVLVDVLLIDGELFAVLATWLIAIPKKTPPIIRIIAERPKRTIFFLSISIEIIFSSININLSPIYVI